MKNYIIHSGGVLAIAAYSSSLIVVRDKSLRFLKFLLVLTTDSMGKNKRQKQKPKKSNNTNHHDNPNRARNTVVRRQHSQQKPNPLKNKITPTSVQQGKASSSSEKTNIQNQQQKRKIPFTKADQVLLVGEGDFSFTASLAVYHEVSSITATCFDTQPVLEGKYPDTKRRIEKLNAKVPQQQQLDVNDIDIKTTEEGPTDLSKSTEPEWNGFSSSNSDDEEDKDRDKAQPQPKPKNHIPMTVLYGIDATKLSTTHKKILRPYSPFTKIVFNFPHVGGLSTDVNRQVRANQQLLVGFFNAAKSLLATPSNPVRRIQFPPSAYEYDPDEYISDNEDDDHDDFLPSSKIKPGSSGGSQILVTLFEGEPYTLWNIRDLARHSGLKVVESFKFPWSAYPGYRHARTIGDIVTGKDRGDEGKRKGAWRGEERDARCYVLELKDQDDENQRGDNGVRVGKRKKGGEDSDSD